MRGSLLLKNADANEPGVDDFLPTSRGKKMVMRKIFETRVTLFARAVTFSCVNRRGSWKRSVSYTHMVFHALLNTGDRRRVYARDKNDANKKDFSETAKRYSKFHPRIY